MNTDMWHFRGKNWPVKRRRAIIRDKYTCQDCKIVKEKGLHVHHIKPYRLYKRSVDANRLKNLITLCAKCHTKADKLQKAIYGKKQTRAQMSIMPAPSRGGNWSSMRKAAILRDKSTCRACLTELSSGINVHHVKPLRLFKDKVEGNALKNLVTLCHDCHILAEADARLLWPLWGNKVPPSLENRYNFLEYLGYKDIGLQMVAAAQKEIEKRRGKEIEVKSKGRFVITKPHKPWPIPKHCPGYGELSNTDISEQRKQEILDREKSYRFYVNESKKMDLKIEKYYSDRQRKWEEKYLK